MVGNAEHFEAFLDGRGRIIFRSAFRMAAQFMVRVVVRLDVLHDGHSFCRILASDEFSRYMRVLLPLGRQTRSHSIFEVDGIITVFGR